MNFLYPSFLFGLIGIGIPIIIHLFNFQRPKQVLFTNVKFLKTVQESTTSARKLKHLLVLISRILFIIFLVLAFAQPILIDKSSSLAKGTENVGIYLDNSLSMEIEKDGERAIDGGIKSIQSISDLYKHNSDYFLVTNDFEGKDQFVRNSEKFAERISEITFSPIYRSLSEINQRQRNFFDSRGSENYNVFWFSDFQKSTVGDLSSLTLDSTKKYLIVPLQNTAESNVFIDSLYLEEPVIKVNQPNTLTVVIANSGNKEVQKVPVKLLLNDVQYGYSTINIPAQGKAELQFSFSISSEGQQRGLIHLEDNAYKFDNEYYFVVNPNRKINIYHVFNSSEKSITNLYSNEEIFNLENDPVGQINYSKISESDLVILNGLDNYSTGLEEYIRKFVEKGGSLVVIPGKGDNINILNKIISPFQVSPQKADSSRKKEFEVDFPDIRNPFFKDIFQKNDKSVAMPYALPTIKIDQAFQTLLKYKNGSPYISYYQAGTSGRIYLFTSPLDIQYSNFQRHSLFVPVMYKMAFNSAQAVADLAYSFQNPIVSVKLEEKPDPNTIFSLESTDTKLIPGQRQIDRNLQIDIPRDKMKAGFYSLKSKNKEHLLAFNYGSKESSMDFYTPKELKEKFFTGNNVNVFEIQNSEEFSDIFKNQNIGTPLWKYCLILSLIFLLTEILLLRFL